MNRWQKIAWYNIAVISLALGMTAINIAVMAMKYGFPKAFSGLGTLGSLGLLGLAGVIFKKKKDQVDFDERDRLIFYKSMQTANAVFWPLFSAACMIPWFIVGAAGTVSSNILPLILGSMGVTVIVLQSLATLIQYNRGGDKNE
jgi:hypothetical protein